MLVKYNMVVQNEVYFKKAARQFADLVYDNSIEFNEAWTDEKYKYVLKRSANGIANITIEPLAELGVSSSKEIDKIQFVGAILKELEHIQEAAQKFEKLGLRLLNK